MSAAQLSLFGPAQDASTPLADRYPHGPGFKSHGTSSAAAHDLAASAARLRMDVLREFTAGEGTADQIATRIGRSILSVRPRVSELSALGKIEQTGERRKNEVRHDRRSVEGHVRKVRLQHNSCICCPSTCLTPFDPWPNQAEPQRRSKKAAVRGEEKPETAGAFFFSFASEISERLREDIFPCRR